MNSCIVPLLSCAQEQSQRGFSDAPHGATHLVRQDNVALLAVLAGDDRSVVPIDGLLRLLARRLHLPVVLVPA
jgi:hypothetical protein